MAELIKNNSATGLPIQDMTEQMRDQIASHLGMSKEGVHVVLMVAVPHAELSDYGTTLSQANTGHLCRTIANHIARKNLGSKLILPN